MAGLLSTGSVSLEAEIVATIRLWASTPCDPYPCARETFAYACRLSRKALPPLPVHRSRRDVAGLLKAKGGLVAYASEMMTGLGWMAVDVPARGDVGVVFVPVMGLTCAICLEGATANRSDALWMAKGDRQMLVITASDEKTWRLPCPRP